MQITTTTLPNRSPRIATELSTRPAEKDGPIDGFTFGYRSRRSKKKMLTAGAVAAGVGIGSLAAGRLTADLTGAASKMFGGVSGGIVGAAVLGVAGIGLAAVFDDSPGMGSLGGAIAGTVIGAGVGAVAGAIGGALLGNGAGNVLGYGFGAVAGGAVGGFAAKGFLS